MKLLSLFSGIGAFEKALDNLEIPYELVAYCEIDKYASKSYAAIHGVSEQMNLGDITKVDEKALPKDIDLITYGFPCQDISLAGKQKGLFNEDGSQTRSGLFFEALRIIEETQPRVAIAENVKNLTSKKFSEQFKIVLDSLEQAGYNNYWQVLNAKDYGIPQNRERVFIVSIRKDIDTGSFKFPEGFPLQLRLKDMLEDEVDERYYLKKEPTKLFQPDESKDVHQVAQMYGTDVEPNPSGGRVYDSNYLMRTLGAGNGMSQPLIVEPSVMKVGNVNPSGKGMNGTVIDSEGLARTITQEKGEGQKILVREATKLGYAGAVEGDSINLEQPNSKTRRGRVGHGVAQTLTTSCNQAVVINPLKDKTQYGWHFEQNVYDPNGITRAVKAGGGSGNIPKVIEKESMTNERAADIMRNEQCCQDDPVFVEAYKKAIDALDNQTIVEKVECLSDGLLRIRKLTPKECFRLMGFDDSDFEKAEVVNSNTQLYKQAGNSIVVLVVEYIINELLDCGALRKEKKENKEMELKMNEYQLPEKILFNYEELKQELTEKVAMYETMVYTDDQIKDAKADKANLNKLKKALNDERIRQEREYMKPFCDFKEKINEIISIIDKPVAVIDKQVKEYEEKQKQEKLDEITEFYNSTEHPEWLHISQIMNDKWLNASTSMKSIQESITSGLESVKNSIETLSNLPEFGFEAVELYKQTLDVSKAINEARRMSEMAKAKAEREAELARIKADQEAALEMMIREEEAKKSDFSNEVNQSVTPESIQNSEPNADVIEPVKQWISFSALLSTEDALALRDFFNSRQIEFKAI